MVGAQANAGPPPVAARTAVTLATACPRAEPADAAARDRCATALRDLTSLPLASGVVWGADQASLPFRKKHLTYIRADIFRLLYLSLFWFTGTVSTEHDDKQNTDVIRIQAYFRNDLPPGDYPYPFWHSSAKWSDYEHANELKFYLNRDGQVFAVTRSAAGSEASRGAYAARVPPAFDGNWQWTDAAGRPQPAVSLFTNKYAAANPNLPALDKTYRGLALALRNGTCLECHTPANKPDMERLVIFQTPLHAAGAIDDRLKQIRDGKMPRDKWDQTVSLDPKLRETMLTLGTQFQQELRAADRWEQQNRVR